MKLESIVLTSSLATLLVSATPLRNDQMQQILEMEQYPVADYAAWDLSERRLVQFERDQEPVWMTELHKIQYKADGINFMDVTNTQDLAGVAGARVREYAPIASNNFVKKVIKTLNTEGPLENLQKLTSFRTRYYRSSTGKDSQKWLLSRINQITDEFADEKLRSSITIQEFKHAWGQNTIIARINGSSMSDEFVIVGAHQDSTNLFPFLPAPGADDDGSGTVTILEAYRGLIANGFSPNRTLEFHWYSAEEGGLLGSQAVAKHYATNEAIVHAMMQMDMTAWVKAGTREEVGIVTDYTDDKLTEFNAELIDAYLDIPYVATKCGYACSDHGSWTKAGYPAVFAIESAFENSNKHIHSGNDRLDISPEFSFTHMLEFSKLAVAFAVELSGVSE